MNEDEAKIIYQRAEYAAGDARHEAYYKADRIYLKAVAKALKVYKKAITEGK